jgi:hypothetical protein
MQAYWKKGSKHKGDATRIYNELERIKGKHDGVIMPAVIVMEAAKKQNPMHTEFNWDDAEAAHEFRLDQARNLIRSIEIIYPDVGSKPIRAYEVVTQQAKKDLPARKVYRSVEEILNDPEMRDELLGQAIRDALTYRRKYHALSELAQVFTALDNFLIETKVV